MASEVNFREPVEVKTMFSPYDQPEIVSLGHPENSDTPESRTSTAENRN